MLGTLIDLIPSRQRTTLDRITDRISDLGGPKIDATALDQFLARARRGGGRAARRTQQYVLANPRKTGMGVGAAVGVAVGLVALTRMYESRKAARLEEDAPDTPEELAEKLSATDAADTDTLPA